MSNIGILLDAYDSPPNMLGAVVRIKWLMSSMWRMFSFGSYTKGGAVEAEVELGHGVGAFNSDGVELDGVRIGVPGDADSDGLAAGETRNDERLLTRTRRLVGGTYTHSEPLVVQFAQMGCASSHCHF